MTTDELIQSKIRERRTHGLFLVVRHPDGEETTLYPKDAAAKSRWVVAFKRRGYAIIAQ